MAVYGEPALTHIDGGDENWSTRYGGQFGNTKITYSLHVTYAKLHMHALFNPATPISEIHFADQPLYA